MATITASQSIDTEHMPDLAKVKDGGFWMDGDGWYSYSASNTKLTYPNDTPTLDDDLIVSLFSSANNGNGDFSLGALYLFGTVSAVSFYQGNPNSPGSEVNTWNISGITPFDVATLYEDASAGLPSLPSILLSGADDISGSPFADRLFAFAGADTVTGDDGNDVINGGSGSDTLSGGLGLDSLTGGSDADFFLFETAPAKGNIDTISDFELGADKIHLDASVYTKLKVGALKGKAFAKGSDLNKAKDKSDRIIYDKKDGELRYDPDGKGGTKAKVIAILDDSPNKLSVDDFLIVP